MPTIPHNTKWAIIGQSGNTCSFPGCHERRTSSLDVAYIEPAEPSGPSYEEARRQEDGLVSLSDVIVLCTNHRRLIDKDPGRYTAQAVRAMRDIHLATVALAAMDAVSQVGIAYSRVNRGRSPSLLKSALAVWGSERRNSDEGFWQSFFEERPQLLLTLTPLNALALKSRCYIGGKTLENVGSNLVDFLAQGRGNATLIEIKTPAARLLGPQYRANVWLPSKDLLGGTLQILEYRSSLVQNIHSLRAVGSDLDAPDPPCIVLIGDMQAGFMSRAQRRSFELYRQSLRSVLVITYDEFFSRLQMIYSLFGAASTGTSTAGG